MRTVGMSPLGVATEATPEAYLISRLADIKNEAILYDSILFEPFCLPLLSRNTSEKTISLLFETEIFIFNPIEGEPDSDLYFPIEEVERDAKMEGMDLDEYMKKIISIDLPSLHGYIEADLLYDIVLRNLSSHFNRYSRSRYFPILSNSPPQTNKQISSRGDVIVSLLRHLPIIDSKTPWEKIIDFRNDPATTPQLDRLKHWATFAAKEKLTISQLDDYIQYEINSYREHMKLHDIKTNLGTMQTVVTGAAEILDNLLQLKFKPIAEALFSVEKESVALLEAELAAPGRDLAYIVNAQDVFRK